MGGVSSMSKVEGFARVKKGETGSRREEEGWRVWKTKKGPSKHRCRHIQFIQRVKEVQTQRRIIGWDR